MFKAKSNCIKDSVYIDGGFSGTSMLFSQLFPTIPLSIFLILLNVPSLLYGYKRNGKIFTFYAILGVCVYSISAYIIRDVIKIDFLKGSPSAGKDLLICAIFGGILSGAGSGITIRFGGALDGTEVMAVIFAKRLGLTVGNFVLIYNVLLYTIIGFVTGSFVLPLYQK